MATTAERPQRPTEEEVRRLLSALMFEALRFDVDLQNRFVHYERTGEWRVLHNETSSEIAPGFVRRVWP